MSEKELLYIEDSINHFVYMEKICNDIINCLDDKNLVKTVKKVKQNYNKLISTYMEVIENE